MFFGISANFKSLTSLIRDLWMVQTNISIRFPSVDDWWIITKLFIAITKSIYYILLKTMFLRIKRMSEKKVVRKSSNGILLNFHFTLYKIRAKPERSSKSIFRTTNIFRTFLLLNWIKRWRKNQTTGSNDSGWFFPRVFSPATLYLMLSATEKVSKMESINIIALFSLETRNNNAKIQIEVSLHFF